MSMLGKLNDGKGFEWYHLILVGIIVWFVAFHQGAEKGTLDTQRCDMLEVTLDNKEFQPSNIVIHPCDSIRFSNEDYTNYDVQDSMNVSLFKIGTGEEVTRQFSKQGTYVYHTDKYPEIMAIQVVVE